MTELNCPNSYTSYTDFKNKFMIDDHEGEKCLHCRALQMDDSSDGMIRCSIFDKEDNYDN